MGEESTRQQSSCQSCGGEMQIGFTADRDAVRDTYRQVEWHSGEPQPAPQFFGMFNRGIKVDEGIPIIAWRCSGCGRLEFFAQ